MRFKKNVPAELREILREQLKQYKKEIEMTREELHDLEEWVSSGRSPYENGDYICTEGGYPMDFISAERLQKAETEWFNSLSDDEREEFRGRQSWQYDTATDDIYRAISDYEMQLKLDSIEELPFS